MIRTEPILYSIEWPSFLRIETMATISDGFHIHLDLKIIFCIIIVKFLINKDFIMNQHYSILDRTVFLVDYIEGRRNSTSNNQKR